ncbi:MAG: hypothetical protein M0C28_40705 [Candidatus Moduliflexus flocculans]|nr:hypothetical protein [Candidatus Moduliflexus flocculans]
MNRACVGVELGVGVRVVKGDQTGYGYTEDLSPEALLDVRPHRRRHRRRARPAPGPPRLPRRRPTCRPLPGRRPRWEDVRPGREAAAPRRAQRAGPSPPTRASRKVNVYLRATRRARC